jgi:RNA polymerase sigma factor (sigma-70 family)
MCSRDDRSLISYIIKTIYDSYIKRSMHLKKLHNIVSYSDLSNSELNYVEAVSATTDTYFINELFALNKVMTKPEVTVIKMLYLQGFTVKEIASNLGITRQAVNQMKKRALKKLRILYADKL